MPRSGMRSLLLLEVEPRDGAEQRLGVRVVRRVEHVRRRPDLDELGEVHDADAVGDVAHHRQVVADEHVGRLLLGLQLHQQVEDARLHGDVERRGRLVADHQVRVAGEGAGDGDALLLAAGELRRPLEQEARLDAHVGGELVDLGAHGARLGAAELAHGAREDLARAPGRVERGVRVLEDHLDGAQGVLRALARPWP